MELNKLKDLSETQSLAFCGALFAMAAAEGLVEPGQSALILQLVDAESFSRSTKNQLQCYSIMPPALEDCLKELPLWDDNLRWQLIFYLLELAWFDDVLDILPVAGYGDDLAVFMTALPVILKNLTPEVTEKARQQTNQWLGKKKAI